MVDYTTNTYSQKQAQCQALGGDLVMYQTFKEQQMVGSAARLHCCAVLCCDAMWGDACTARSGAQQACSMRSHCVRVPSGRLAVHCCW
jgi:hypothetical protein